MRDRGGILGFGVLSGRRIRGVRRESRYQEGTYEVGGGVIDWTGKFGKITRVETNPVGAVSELTVTWEDGMITNVHPRNVTRVIESKTKYYAQDYTIPTSAEQYWATLSAFDAQMLLLDIGSSTRYTQYRWKDLPPETQRKIIEFFELHVLFEQRKGGSGWRIGKPRKKVETEEWEVPVYKPSGERDEGKTYYTPYQDDAWKTYHAMLKEFGGMRQVSREAKRMQAIERMVDLGISSLAEHGDDVGQTMDALMSEYGGELSDEEWQEVEKQLEGFFIPDKMEQRIEHGYKVGNLVLLDNRSETSHWIVVDKTKQKSTWDWRSGIVFRGKKKECLDFMHRSTTLEQREPGTKTGFSEFDAAEKELKGAFPGVKIEVTAGPYRGTDVTVNFNDETETYNADFYSPIRMGFGDLRGAIDFAHLMIAYDLCRRGKLTQAQVREKMKGKFFEVYTGEEEIASKINWEINNAINRSAAGAAKVNGLWSVVVDWKFRTEDNIERIKDIIKETEDKYKKKGMRQEDYPILPREYRDRIKEKRKAWIDAFIREDKLKMKVIESDFFVDVAPYEDIDVFMDDLYWEALEEKKRRSMHQETPTVTPVKIVITKDYWLSLGEKAQDFIKKNVKRNLLKAYLVDPEEFYGGMVTTELKQELFPSKDIHIVVERGSGELGTYIADQLNKMGYNAMVTQVIHVPSTSTEVK